MGFSKSKRSSSSGGMCMGGADEMVTPATARSASSYGGGDDAAVAEATATDARNRLRGIRSTYNRFQPQGEGTATTDRLG